LEVQVCLRGPWASTAREAMRAVAQARQPRLRW
jgi:hypothetical protein